MLIPFDQLKALVSKSKENWTQNDALNVLLSQIEELTEDLNRALQRNHDLLLEVIELKERIRAYKEKLDETTAPKLPKS